MATYRIGIGSINLKDGAVGIGTESTGLGNLKVEGTYKVTDLDVTGVSTFTRYAGFAPDNLEIGKDSRDRTLTGEHFVTGDIVVGVNSTFTVSAGATVDVGTVPSVSIGTHFSPPTGGVEERPEAVHEGMVRFNTDLNTLEFYNGVDWRQFTVNGATGRAVVGGGNYPLSPNFTSDIQTFNISTFGNAINFGDLSNGARFALGSGSDGIRGIFYAGQDGPSTPRNYIDEVSMVSEGNSIDFGDASSAGRCFGGCGSSTRGIFGGINAGSTCDTIQYATKGSTVSSFITFGVSGGNKNAMFSSPVKMINHSGEGTSAAQGGEVVQNQAIETATIASGGTTTFFGTLLRNTRQLRGTCNNTRGMFFGGYSSYPAYLVENHIDYVTISSNGNAVDFGDLSQPRAQSSCTAHSTRAVAAGGGGDPWPGGSVNFIDYVTIASTGNGQDFGDLMHNLSAGSACSDSNGGLGGY